MALSTELKSFAHKSQKMGKTGDVSDDILMKTVWILKTHWFLKPESNFVFQVLSKNY